MEYSINWTTRSLFLVLRKLSTGVYAWNDIPGDATSKTKYNYFTQGVYSWRIQGACGPNGTSWATTFLSQYLTR